MKLAKQAFLFSFFILLFSCNKDDNDDLYIAISPVKMDLTQVPFPKLSDYNFFQNELKNQEPVLGVIPYKPESELFTDYAEKKRFVWIPSGTKATYVNDYSVLELPVGSATIKSFYYNHVLPSNTTRIIET